MNWFHRLLNSLRPGRIDRDLDEEIAFHLEMRAAAYERNGLSPEEARRAATRRFGGSPLLVRERVRDVRLLAWLDSVRQDAVLGVRVLRRSPVMAVAAILSLALGIGSVTGLFAVGDALLLRRLPVPHAEQLLVPQWQSSVWPDMGIWGSNDDDNNNWSFSYPMYEQFSRTPGLEVAGFQDLDDAVTQIRGMAGTANGSLVTGRFFQVLRLTPAVGRLISDADDSPAAQPVVVLSHRYWQRAFGGDPAAIGRPLRINGIDLTIAGVAPRTFFGAVPGRWSDFYVPASLAPKLVAAFVSDAPLTSDRFWWVQLIVRARPGTTPAAVQAALKPQFDALVKPRIRKPEQHAYFSVRPGDQGYVFMQDQGRKPFLIFSALVVLVLLVACSNVANLLLARAAARQREAAMRLALGAGRLRIVRQHLTESLVLAIVSGGVGFVFGRWFAGAIMEMAHGLVLDLGITWREVGVAAATSVGAGLLVGLGPALTLSRSSVAGALRSGAAVRTGWGRRLGLRRPLVAVQIALSLLVLVVAGLFVRTLGNLQAVPLGLDADRVMLFEIDPTSAGYSPERKASATERIADRLRRLPAVSAVTWSSMALLDGRNWMTSVRVVGEPKQERSSCLLSVGPGFHQALRIPLVAGRLFDERDGRSGPKVAVVNEAFVKLYFRGAWALGRTFLLEMDRSTQEFEVVGVVRDSKYARVRQENPPIAFFPSAQNAVPMGPVFLLKYREEAETRLAADIMRVVHELEPAVPVTGIRTFQEQVAEQLSTERSLSLVSSALGAVALLLAALGLYGVMAFAVTRRTGELGVRLALGASRAAVLRLVMADGARVVVPGACIGMAAAFGATRFLESMLFGLKPTDPLTLVAAAALLLSVASFAAYLPARRAAAIDPVEALRCE